MRSRARRDVDNVCSLILQSSIVAEQLDNYYHGGLHDMIRWTHECWHDVFMWIDLKRSDMPFDRCKVFKYHENDVDADDNAGDSRSNAGDSDSKTRIQPQPAAMMRAMLKRARKYFPSVWHEIEKAVTVERDDKEGMASLSVHRDFEQRIEAAVLAVSSSFPATASKSQTCRRLADPPIWNDPMPNSDNAGFGHALLTGEWADRPSILLISAPHATVDTGIVYAYDASAASYSSSAPFLTLHGDVPGGRFGWSMVWADLNGDGRADLAIGQPSACVDDPMRYCGRIHVFFGSSDDASEHQATKVLLVYPDITIDGGEVEMDGTSMVQLGSYLTSVDVDGDGFLDLIAGVPHATVDGNKMVWFA